MNTYDHDQLALGIPAGAVARLVDKKHWISGSVALAWEKRDAVQDGSDA